MTSFPVDLGVIDLTQVRVHTAQGLGGDNPRQIWSLWDMLTKLGGFLRLPDEIRDMRATLQDGRAPEAVLDDEDRTAIQNYFNVWRGLASRGGFDTMLATMDH